ncbi:HET-domain-containing protein [Apiospora marii]|uniref:HET-domain-containing protein n=1 Tax=Apiospora marii TaxID=335849 RepID=A0ABR1STP8_9PEZI
MWVTKLIDCHKGRVVQISTLDTAPEYVALSYVWAATSATTGKSTKSQSVMPQVVTDAISVTKSLGFRYIWVNRYCVEQDDSYMKHEQIMNMDSIYENATLTIIAATGQDGRRGLPGVSSDRETKEDPYRHANFSVAWLPPSPYVEIRDSPWSKRGWTYQEGILSRRRLVFTDHQVYFECRSMACCESLFTPPSTPNQEAEQPSGHDTIRLPRIFGIAPLDTNEPAPSAPSRRLAVGPRLVAEPAPEKAITFNAYTYCAAKFSQRKLSFDSDSLNAFGGMIKRFESLERGNLRHLWGVPFFDQHDDSSPGDIVDYAGFFLAGLCWQHVATTSSRSNTKQPTPPLSPPRRRKRFPSWSWTGWEGAVTWPHVEETYEVRARDPDIGLASIQLSFEDGTTRSIPNLRLSPQPGADRRPIMDQYPKSLLLQTSAVPANAIPRPGRPGSGEDQFWPQGEPGPEEARLVHLIRNGHLKALRLGTIGELGFLLVVKKRGDLTIASG